MEADTYIDILERENRDLKGRSEHTEQAAGSIFSQNQDGNLIEFQLELDNILERIEHLLKGEKLEIDGDGNQEYKEPENKDLIVLNDYGVQLLMNVISFYLNRNTILSNHKEERIYEILYDLGIELSDLIYASYEKMGLDSEYKRARYPMLVMNILHTVENSYNRSLHGGERDSLRSGRIVTQNQPIGQGPMGSYGQPKKKKWYNKLGF